MHRMVGLMLLVMFVGALGGCPPELYPTLAPTTLEEANEIINDADLTRQERRDELAALGFSQRTINALLSADRFANQYGGDPRSAYEKVTAPDYTRLTPDEVQFFNADAVSVSADYSTEVDDVAAQAIVDLFREYDLDSPEELEAFLDDESNRVPTTIPEGVLEFLFVELDPDLVLPRLP